MNAERIQQVTAVAGGAVGVLGGLLAVTGTLLLAIVPAAVGLLLLGLVCVPIGLLVAVAGRRRADRQAGDALLVRGGFTLHLLALGVTLVLVLRWVAGGMATAPVAVACWGLAAAGYAVLSYGWDRATETNVDAV